MLLCKSAIKCALQQGAYIRAVHGRASATHILLFSRLLSSNATRPSLVHPAVIPPNHEAHSSMRDDIRGPDSVTHCPYMKGSSLDLVFLTPSPATAEEIEVRAKIVNAFTPFTIGQALIVELTEAPPSLRTILPTRFLVKLYDRRFTRDRVAQWTPPLEDRLRTHLREAIVGSRPRPPLRSFGFTGEDEDGFFDSDHPRFEHWHDDILRWEAMQNCVRDEIDAYQRLADLQGISIPQFYGKVRFGSPKPESWMPDWVPGLLDTVDGLALQYIEGVPPNHFKRGVNISEEDAERLCQSAIQIARDITTRGVAHHDIATRNVLVRNADMRPFLIDFGSCSVYTSPPEDEDDQMRSMRNALYGLHIHSPYPLPREPPSQLSGWATINRRIDACTLEELTKGFIPVMFSGPDHEIRWDKEGNMHRFEYLRWQLRPGVRTTKEDWDITKGNWGQVPLDASTKE